jgi:hypothetical protein
MCTKCGNTICCCSEKRVSVTGKQGPAGPRGLTGATGPSGTAVADGEFSEIAQGGQLLTDSFVTVTGATFTLGAGVYLFWFAGTVSMAGSNVTSTIVELEYFTDGVTSSGTTWRFYPILNGTGLYCVAANEKITLTGSQTVTLRAKDVGVGGSGTVLTQSLQYIKIG